MMKNAAGHSRLINSKDLVDLGSFHGRTQEEREQAIYLRATLFSVYMRYEYNAV